jgi:hypothetical protein
LQGDAAEAQGVEKRDVKEANEDFPPSTRSPGGEGTIRWITGKIRRQVPLPRGISREMIPEAGLI